jgi:hypothetical protein
VGPITVAMSTCHITWPVGTWNHSGNRQMMSSALSRVHSEFTTLFIRWPEKFEKGGGEVLILFFFNGLHLEGKSMSLLKFFVVV